ncbi:hypothetical protein [Streptomyces camelliae]|uniref:Uncharacterized protein n=1 Tax=Streptomyces camelliae TaxID=3004093 RepID=A0ABY7NX22_9ACTN|nr:hypothetical protein [Streptomyces sp. HUAS 2-6]WBO62783.1 hypothetical protein O1G22_08105 [Streptomyces sp. HUAS 2-6]
MENGDEIVTDRRPSLDLAERHLQQVAEQRPALLHGRRNLAGSGSAGSRTAMCWDLPG